MKVKPMIDIHCLIHPGFNQEWYRLIKAQMANEPEVVFHEVWNEASINDGRVKGFALGDTPYVGFVDSDDLIEPGIFAKILAEFERGAEIVSCNEMLIDENGKVIMPGVLLAPHLYPDSVVGWFPPNINHHILCFRRKLLAEDYAAQSAAYINRFPDSFGDAAVFAVRGFMDRNAVLVHAVGYYYRRHKDQVTAWIEQRLESEKQWAAPGKQQSWEENKAETA